MSGLFIDTSFLLALELSSDQNHAPALRFWSSIVAALPALITTSYIFDETVTYFNSRRLHSKAVQVGNMLLKSRSIQFVQVDEPLFFEAWSYFERHQDKQYSLTDCISFSVMQRLSLSEVLTFDKHFTQAGFLIRP